MPLDKNALLGFPMHSVLAVKGTILFDLQPAWGLPFIFGCGIIFSLALGALQLNDFSSHVFTSPSQKSGEKIL
jgi:hypothetical protein